MTIQHVLEVPAGTIKISYEWHFEMHLKQPHEKFARFKSISTVIRVPMRVATSHDREARIATPETEHVVVNGDWCSPLMVKQLARMYLKGMERGITANPQHIHDVRDVLAELETT